MPKTAAGIHDHPTFKTGLIESDPTKRILAIDDLFTGKLPTIPAHEDRFSGVTFALDKNDQYGTCGPTSLDNYVRAGSKVATGTSSMVGWPAVEALYKQSGNPNFPREDNGVEMGTMLDAALAHGFGSHKLIAFGKLLKITDANLAALNAIFGGSLWGMDLLEAQQAQTEARPPLWDYVASGPWGGHAVYNGKFEPFGVGQRSKDDLRDVQTIATLAEMLRASAVGIDEEVISWVIDVETTPLYRAKQLEEVWVPIFDFHLTHPAFLEGVDTAAFAEAFHELTGKTLPKIEPTPTPVPPVPNPSPTPGADPDAALWAATEHWRTERHVGDNAHARDAVVTWGKSKGFK